MKKKLVIKNTKYETYVNKNVYVRTFENFYIYPTIFKCDINNWIFIIRISTMLLKFIAILHYRIANSFIIFFNINYMYYIS